MTTCQVPREALRLSLGDVARAAHVQRPVVSMWRSRCASGPTPFPPPLQDDRDERVWSVVDVANWFQAYERHSGRLPGNNPSVVDDLPAFARLDLSATDGVAMPILEALLTLSAITGEGLADLTAAELLHLAFELDPGDEYLRAELSDVPIEPRLLALCDELANAAYSGSAALEALAADAERRTGTGFAAELLELWAEGVIAVGRTISDEQLSLVLLDAGVVTVGLAVARRDPLVGLTLISSGDALSRSAIRRLKAAGVETEIVTAAGGLSVSGAAVIVGDVHDLPVRAALDAIDDVVLRLDSSQLALLIGDAAALAKPLADASDVKLRDSWLRSGQLRMVAKLPAGVLRHHHSARLSFGLFGPSPVGIPSRNLAVVTADLGDQKLADLRADDVVTDLVVATSAHRLGREHVLRTARLVSVPALLAANGDLTRRTVADADADPSRGVDRSIALRAEELRATLGRVGEGWQVVGGARQKAIRACTVDHAIGEGWLRLLPGQRLRDEHLATDGRGVRVIGVDQVRFGTTPRTIDRVELEWRYAGSRTTEPGDVIFSATAGAMVDDSGDAVVQTPLRVLRITEEGRAVGLSPQAIAFDLARQSAPARDVRLLRIRPLPPDQPAELEATAARIAARRTELAAELAQLEQLERTLVESVASGYARIEITTPNTKD
ncbi:hypothetical protein [Calidifontibacter terrae]